MTVPTVEELLAELTVLREQLAQKDREAAALRQAQKLEALGQFAGVVAKEFNNLLTVIGGYAELLGSRVTPDGPGPGYLAQLRQAVTRAATRTSQLSAFGRRQLATPRRLEINALLRDWAPRLRQIVGPNVELRYDLTESSTVVYADAGEFQQVVLHLVQNGYDAMPAGGVLTIRTTCLPSPPSGAGFAGPSVCVSVGDTGTGMTEEVRAHLFEPFFTTKGVGRGTGLGLAAVHGIVTQAGGHIAAESTPGRGSTFQVYLPLSASDPGRRMLAAPAELSGHNTILLAEDEPAVRTVVSTVLRTNGYSVLEAGDGREALALWEQYGPAVGLLLTDLLMPHLGGVELASRLREQRPDLPAVFMSAYADNDLVHEGLRIAGIPFLQKPFRPDALLEVVRQSLGQSGGPGVIPGE